eukprot:CAMPEP_0178896558 /NCGR_PEP_ID=MMETSP0786-20121207/1245_1 /TAXON_ID=186022 /ORGANISM="Thalassionema frauenfeldii, Strain CCMP 1798" /LENGTH=472 /DNA_ID=CAMNT_0020566985 /DNA_START=397 /DNA_END=1815 /DNA_ORIENTATION=+
MTCAINVVAGQYVSAVMCQWQSWYCVFDFTANSWMNAVVALELHRLLKDCRRGYHYRPPPIKKVVFRSLMVYVYSAFVASWTLFGFLPHRADVTAGLACLPVEFSIGSTIFFWLVFIPAFFGIPFAIFLHVCWDVHRKKMLPSNERTRQLFIFFMRLTLVFILMWLPTVVLLFAIGVPDVWASFVGGSWSHLQGLVSAAFCLTKADVRSAVVHFICCKSHELERDEDTSWFGVIRSSIIRRTSSLIPQRRRSSRLSDVHCRDLNIEERRKVFEKMQDSFKLESTASSEEHTLPNSIRSSQNTCLKSEKFDRSFTKDCAGFTVDVEQPDIITADQKDKSADHAGANEGISEVFDDTVSENDASIVLDESSDSYQHSRLHSPDTFPKSSNSDHTDLNPADYKQPETPARDHGDDTSDPHPSSDIKMDDIEHAICENAVSDWKSEPNINDNRKFNVSENDGTHDVASSEDSIGND